MPSLLKIFGGKAKAVGAVLEPSDAVVAIGAKEATHYFSGVAMIYGKAVLSAMPDHGFRVIANGASPILMGMKFGVSLRRYTVGLLQMSRPDKVAPFLISKSIPKVLEIFSAAFSSFLRRRPARVFNKVFNPSVISVIFPKAKGLWRILPSHMKPYNVMSGGSNPVDTDVSMKDGGLGFYRVPVTSDGSSFNRRIAGWITPPKRKRIVGVVIKEMADFFDCAFHNVYIIQCVGGFKRKTIGGHYG